MTERVGIASQFLQNAYVNGEQAARSLDELSRNALFGAYLGGNTRVRTTLASAGPAVSVDDVRGFQTVFVNGVQQAVSSSTPMTVTIGSDAYTLVGVAIDSHERVHGTEWRFPACSRSPETSRYRTELLATR